MQVATIPSTHYNMGGRAFSMALVLPRDGEGNAAEHVRVAIASVDGTLRVVNGFNPDSVVAGFATKKDVPFSAMAVVPIQDRDAIIAGVHCPTIRNRYDAFPILVVPRSPRYCSNQGC